MSIPIPVIPADTWKESRDRMVARIVRSLHVTEVNPGPDAARLRYDYTLTRAEVVKIVEHVMRKTEHLTLWHAGKVAPPPEVSKANIPLPALPPEKPRETRCFMCDGTGLICDVCGESQAFGCTCNVGFSDCEDCGGTGK